MSSHICNTSYYCMPFVGHAPALSNAQGCGISDLVDAACESAIRFERPAVLQACPRRSERPNLCARRWKRRKARRARTAPPQTAAAVPAAACTATTCRFDITPEQHAEFPDAILMDKTSQGTIDT